jgi:hypothetical protein
MASRRSNNPGYFVRAGFARRAGIFPPAWFEAKEGLHPTPKYRLSNRFRHQALTNA